jgi:hypothetical protein
MKLWRKSKRVEKELPSFLKIGLVKFNQRLIGIANFLQEKTNGYSVKKKKILLLLFVIVFFAETTAVIIQAVKQRSKTSIAVTRIKTIPVETTKPAVPLITKTEFLRIQRFKNYIDSLNISTQGKKLRYSLLHNRPHLMDSVNYLISLYLEQLKNKEK